MKSTLREEELVYLRAKLDEKYIVEALQGILENDPEKYILDVGCGIGGSAEIIKNYYSNVKVVGVDIDKNIINKAISRNSNINFVCANAEQLPFDSEQFHCCMARMLLDICNKCDRILDEMVRVLKKDGFLVLYGNTDTTYTNNKELKLKIKNAYARYLRLSGKKGYDPIYIRSYLENKYKMSVEIREIVKDIYNPGRESLSDYYGIHSEENIKNNILVKLGLISEATIRQYAFELNKSIEEEYAAFKQAVIIARK